MSSEVSAVRAYLLAVSLVIAAALVRFVLDPALGWHGPFLIFILAVAAAAWVGGWRPGLFATALSALVAIWFFVDPRYAFRISTTEHWVYLIVFLVEALLFCLFAERLRGARQQREESLRSEQAARHAAESAAAAAAEELRIRQRIEEDLRRSNQDLERFAFVVSHDIREPLRTIRAGVLDLAENAAAARDRGGKVLQSIAGVEILIADLLSYARLGHTGVESDTAVRLEDVLMWTRTNLAAVLQENSAEITSEELPAVFADFGALSQVFQNIVTNAVKYRSRAAPRIHVRAAEAADYWTISIEDNGMGIDPAFAESIFAPFKRLHGREVPGTGIGLSICRRIVERLGGRIWVESGAAGGSVFKFTFPARLVEVRRPAPAQQPSIP